MSAFTEINWQEALTSVYARSLTDPTYRNLCLTDPAAAIAAVSVIELPPQLKFKFFDKREDFVYHYFLPPVQAATGSTTPEDQSAQLIRWATICSWPTTLGEM